MITIQTQNFGVEIELTGITREKAAKTIAEYFSQNYRHTGGSYDAWTTYDREGRIWKALSAWAINCPNDNLFFKSTANMTQEQKAALMLRVLTKRLKMRGPEFKTARLHLTSAFTQTATAEDAA